MKNAFRTLIIGSLLISLPLKAISASCKSLFERGDQRIREQINEVYWALKSNGNAGYFEDSKISFIRSSFKDGLAEIRKKAETNGGYYKPTPVNPSVPELVMYNWFSENVTNVTNGLSAKTIKSLAARKHHLHIGLYAADSPYQWGSFNRSVLMEVAVYALAFPVEVNGKTEWVKTTDEHYTVDHASGADYDRSYKGEDSVRAFIILDPRVIKELRFPDKNLVLEAWHAADFKSESIKERGPYHLGRQWLITPNYTFAERRQIVESEPSRFIDYLRNMYPLHVPTHSLNEQRTDIDSVTMLNAMSLLLGMNGDFIDATRSTLNYRAIQEAVMQADPIHLDYVKALVEQGGKNEKLIMALKLALLLRDGKNPEAEKLREQIKKAVQEKIADMSKYARGVNLRLGLQYLKDELSTLSK